MQDRWRLAPLTINYRTPAEIMTVAADVLAAIDPELELPRSVREPGPQPWRLETPAAGLPGQLARAAPAIARRTADRREAGIVAAARLRALRAAAGRAPPGAPV